MELFLRQQPSEQHHSLRIFDQLVREGERSPDLLAAALLHDVGKSRFPLNPLERSAVVIGYALWPEQAKKWGQGQPWGWKRPFVVAAQHPRWGAEMAQAAGAAPLTVNLIRRHQEARQGRERQGESDGIEDQLLAQLQRYDDES
jgi:hypothetical protein